MTHILRIHPDLIKLDVELTRHIDIDAQRRALVRSLVEFARSVGATLVAEGIETEAELHALRALGVAAGQGYHLGRPEPLPGREDVTAHDRPRGGILPSVALALGDASSYLRVRRMARRDGAGGGALRPAFVAVVACLVLMPAGLAFADDAAPGAPAYWLKRRIESVRLVVALDRQSETRLHLDFARRRMDELSELLSEGRAELAPMVLDDYGAHIDAVAGSLLSGERAPRGLRSRIVRDLTDHIAALNDDRATLCLTGGAVKTCGSADAAISRSKRALTHSERAARKAPKQTTLPPSSNDAKPKNPNAKGTSSQGHQQNPD